MRSGISHLNKRMETERKEVFSKETAAATAPKTTRDTRTDLTSELDEPRWSVVSFDKREAGGLTYRQATELMAFLDERGLHGLCVVTDDAAARYHP